MAFDWFLATAAQSPTAAKEPPEGADAGDGAGEVWANVEVGASDATLLVGLDAAAGVVTTVWPAKMRIT